MLSNFEKSSKNVFTIEGLLPKAQKHFCTFYFQNGSQYIYYTGEQFGVELDTFSLPIQPVDHHHDQAFEGGNEPKRQIGTAPSLALAFESVQTLRRELLLLLFYTITVYYYRGSYIDPKLHESEKGGYISFFFLGGKSKKRHTHKKH